MEEQDQTDSQQAMPDLAQNFGPGEASAVEGQPNWGDRRQLIPEHYQNIFRGLCQKVALRDMFPRIEEIRKAGMQRFYWRGDFNVGYDERNSTWGYVQNGEVVSGSTSDVVSGDLHYPFNIYQAFGRGFISIVGQIPNVKMEAVKLFSPEAQRISSSADAMRKKIESQNDMEAFAEDVSRLMWTDGRVSLYSRWVTDGARFGYVDNAHDDESPEGVADGGNPPPKKPREAKGGELVTPYGVLECKVPINMRSQAEFMWRQLAFEIDLTSAKAMYPWIAKKMQGGQTTPGEYNFDRTTRIATTQGIRLLSQTGDSVSTLPTWQRTWFRPSFFAEIDSEDDRGWLESNYPDGAMVAFIGETYCESRNESMDDHWEDVHPLPGDGQATPSCGWILVPVQDAVCDMTDLAMETFMKAVPAIWCDKNMVDLQAISQQQSGPGAHYPSKNDLEAGQKMADAFFAEPIPDLSPSAQAFMQQIFSNVPQFLTGLYPASIGESDPANPTLGGQKLLAQASKGQAGVAWRKFREAYTQSMTQLVRIGAYFRAAESENGSIKVSVENEEIDVDLEDLRDGNWACKADGDQAYPVTHSEKQEAYQAFVTMAGQSPEGQSLIFRPKNLVLAKDLNGLEELDIPGADSEEKQLAEIRQLLMEPPIPNQQSIQQLAIQTAQAGVQGQPPPPQPPKEALLMPSVPIDVDFDDHAAELSACTDWINSPTGQQAKRDNADGFMNVRLHALAHKEQVTQAQQQAQQQAMVPQLMLEKAKHSGQEKSPAESINFKDLGPSGKIQVGQQAGLDLRADSAAELAGDTMEPAPPKPAPKPAPKVQ
jgi:hypothetical protein